MRVAEDFRTCFIVSAKAGNVFYTGINGLKKVSETLYSNVDQLIFNRLNIDQEYLVNYITRLGWCKGTLLVRHTHIQNSSAFRCVVTEPYLGAQVDT